MAASAPRKKLIEVSIPLEAINVASTREKSIRHGHPSTLHLWWARRPLAACRAVLFAQLVDDPSSWPDRFPSEEEQDAERKRLHKVIERIVPWEASNDDTILNEARWEIARSVAWGLGEEPPRRNDGKAILDFLQTKAPPVYDPFSGGGSIPLEAQRLGLRAYGSDLNPVAVLIGKALVEIPHKYAGLPPMNPKSQGELKRGGRWNGRGAQGLAEDVRYYGHWMRDEAEKRIGYLYPKARLPDGSQVTVIAWLWARTVRSPDPAAKGAMVPLVSSFMIATKAGKSAWVEPVIDPAASDGYRFEVRNGLLSEVDEERLKRGTKAGRGSNFVCMLTGATIGSDYVKAEGAAGRISRRLLAVVAASKRKRVFLSPAAEHEGLAAAAKPTWEPEGDLPNDPRNFWTVQYGLSTFASLFTPRQLVMLTTISDLVAEARLKVEGDARSGGISSDDTPLHTGGVGAHAYADAIATYLAEIASKITAYHCSLGVWRAKEQKTGRIFGRQALPMVWDFPECNPFAGAGGDWEGACEDAAKVVAELGGLGEGKITNSLAQDFITEAKSNTALSTDPPYYDNVAYADLSDFYYVWLRRTLSDIYPEMFRRILTQKSDELVASPYRHGGVDEAEAFFLEGMKRALAAMATIVGEIPATIYYAFRQAETSEDGITSAGWSTFLQAVVDSGLAVDGTWPVRTEQSAALKTKVNALASSIVLVCRHRNPESPVVTRGEFIRLLKRELPNAINNIRKAGVGPVDMQQSVIGPGMGIFTRNSRVLEDDDSTMTVKTALALINRVWEEIENELDTNFDAETQVALAWFATYGFDAKPSGELITLANAKNVSLGALFASGVFSDGRGKAGLTARAELPDEWSPASDKGLTVWECVQHTARVLNAEDGGGEAAARLVAEMGSKAADARALAYRLYEIASQKGWAAEALIYNELAQEWPKLEELASTAGARRATIAAQGSLL
jgi:putative DNA methylase